MYIGLLRSMYRVGTVQMYTRWYVYGTIVRIILRVVARKFQYYDIPNPYLQRTAISYDYPKRLTVSTFKCRFACGQLEYLKDYGVLHCEQSNLQVLHVIFDAPPLNCN